LSLILLLVPVPLHAQNFHIVDALIRSGNYMQAQNYLVKINSTGPEVRLYHGILAFCLGEDQVGLEHLKNSYLNSEKRAQDRTREHLLSYFEKVQVSPEIYFQLHEILFKSRLPGTKWMELWARYLFDAKSYARILEVVKTMDSPQIMNWVYRAHKMLSKEEEFFHTTSQKSFHSPLLVQEYLRLLLESGRIPEALERFDQLRERTQPWISDVYLLLGTELGKIDLQKKGYQRKIALTPSQFENYRALSSLLYEEKLDQQAEEILLGYLKKFPKKYKGAREIAQVFVDHGRLERLNQFIKDIRKKLRNPLALHDLALYAYSIRKDYGNFFAELLKMNPNISGKTWGKRLVDSFQNTDILEGFENFKTLHGSEPATRGDVLFHVVRNLDNPADTWIDEEFQKLPGSILLDLAREANRAANPDLLVRILAPSAGKWKLPENQEETSLLGLAYTTLGKYEKAYELLASLAKGSDTQPKILLKLLVITYNLQERRTEVPRWFQFLYAHPKFGTLSKTDRTRSMEQVLEVLVFLGDKVAYEEVLKNAKSLLSREVTHYLSLLSEILEDGKAGFEKSSLFLSNRLASSRFPVVQESYMLYLDFKEVSEEVFFTDFISTYRNAFLGRPKALADSLLRLEKAVENHWAKDLFSAYLLYNRMVYHQLKYRLASTEVEGELSLQEWKKLAGKLFEEFPDSLYTPRVVDYLVQVLERDGQKKEQQGLIQKYLLLHTSDLLAQRLRNLML